MRNAVGLVSHSANLVHYVELLSDYGQSLAHEVANAHHCYCQGNAFWVAQRREGYIQLDTP